MDKEEFAKMLIIAWGIWKERNTRRYEQRQRTPHQIKIWTSSYFDEIKNVHIPKGRTDAVNENSDRNQMGVENHDLVLFVDASLSTSLPKVGLGAVIYTANKRVQARLSKPLEGELSVLHEEALALLVGLQWALNIGLLVKMIFTDSLSLVQTWNNSTENHSELGMILADIKMLLINCPDAKILHVSRKFNADTHNLAKHALQLDDEASWIEDATHNDEDLRQ